MTIIDKVIGGAAKPFTDLAGETVKEVQETKRSIQETERQQSKDIAATKIASAAWRPAIAIAIKWMLIGYVVGSFVYVSVVLYGIMNGNEWANLGSEDSSIFYLQDYWKWVGLTIFSFAGLFLTTYAGGRTLEKMTNGNIGGLVRGAVTAVKGQTPETKVITREVVREPLRTQEVPHETPKRRANIVVPGTPDIEPVEIIEDTTIDIELEPVSDPVVYEYTDHGWQWGPTSTLRLEAAHPDLQTLFHWFIRRSEDDISIGETTRDYATQLENIKTGASSTKYSRHLERPAMAVDFIVLNKDKKPVTTIVDGKEVWDFAYYKKAADLLKIGSKELGIPITWGGDWKTLRDGPHIQLDKQYYPYKMPEYLT